ncbi:MAG: hypothetical protein AABX83_01835 [Nanoarchaeota archaeon]
MEEAKKSDKIEKRKEAIKGWLKNKYNLIFLAILILAIVIYLNNFNLTKKQVLWWDEADYLAYAKNLAGFPINWIITEKHNSLYPYLAAAFFKIGLGELGIKFFLQVIPAILSAALVYFMSNKMYEDKRIGLITSFLMTTFWVNLFNASRFHVDIPALFLGLLSIYVFWQGYENKEKIFGKIEAKWAIPLTVFLVILTYTIRRGYILFGAFFLVHMLASKKFKALIKDKYNWIALGIASVLFFFAEKFIFISQISDISGQYFHEEAPINFLPFQVFPAFFDSVTKMPGVLLYLFWIGAVLLLVNIAFSFGLMKKEGGTRVRADLFNFLTIVITLAFFIYVLRSPTNFGEARWYLPMAFACFILIARAATSITDYIKPYSKHAAIILLCALIAIGGYYEFKQGSDSIKGKLDSFQGIKEASILIKEMSDKEDLVLTLGQPQVEYYAERNTLNARVWGGKYSSDDVGGHFESTMQKIKENPQVRFIVITFSEPAYPEWAKKNSGNVWEIPFMQTKIDFSTGEQQINQELQYDKYNLKFKLIAVKNEVFIYEILR